MTLARRSSPCPHTEDSLSAHLIFCQLNSFFHVLSSDCRTEVLCLKVLICNGGERVPWLMAKIPEKLSTDLGQNTEEVGDMTKLSINSVIADASN